MSRFPMTFRHVSLAILVMCVVAACSEPDGTVMGSTQDGDFSLTLSADPNWVRPEALLPVRVTLVQHDTSSVLGYSDQIAFTASGGSLSPFSLPVTLSPDPADSARGLFTAFVTFRASRMTVEGQGEIHALFRDARATLRIRIVPLATD
jgi:hypothetical protein